MLTEKNGNPHKVNKIVVIEYIYKIYKNKQKQIFIYTIQEITNNNKNKHFVLEHN